MKGSKHTNRLIRETSPYLLQHAHNPVDWHPWNEETLKKAEELDKMILVSIGYSACHWCHVMEHESFEDEGVAKVMNTHFICIKVDREERPDVDQVYMDAVQMISGRGGWPLNCFAMPDGKPVWGGTYFRRDQWLEILDNVALLFSAERKKMEQQAAEIYDGMLKNAFIDPDPGPARSFNKEVAGDMAGLLLNKVDRENGGFRGAPKFPMPNNFLFLLRYHFHSKNPEALSVVVHTLEKMANGGIFDQAGGGFARYSVDTRWHIPHFEKMLYDNAQLVSLYAEAFRITGNPIFSKVISDTLEFIEHELTTPEGGFYAALDADSEGAEGRFYVWTKDEFEEVLGEDAGILSEYFGIGKEAYWEDDFNVLVRAMSPGQLAAAYQLSEEDAMEIISRGRSKLLKARARRVRPGLDDKVLTSWNALMLKGYVDAYRAIGREAYLDKAIRNASFLTRKMIKKDGRVMRSYKNGIAAIDGFLDDYSFMMEALIALYEVTLDEKWLDTARLMAGYTMTHFYDQVSGMFFYTSGLHKDTVARKIEVTDNVIPASCSSLARALHKLGVLYESSLYTEMSENMLRHVLKSLPRYPSAFSNWGILHQDLSNPFHTLVVTGPDSHTFVHDLKAAYFPNALIAGGASQSAVPVCKNRWDPDITRVFVCTGTECRLPVQTAVQALRIIMQGE